MAAGTLPPLRRRDHVLGARRDRQVGGGNPRLGLGRSGGGEAGHYRAPRGARATVAPAATGPARRGRGGFTGRAAGGLHSLAPFFRGSGRRTPDRARIRRPALGRRGAPRLPRAPSRVVSGSAAARPLRSATGTLRAPTGLGRRSAQRAHNQPRAALASSPAKSSSGRSSSGPEETRSTRKSSCACSQIAASSRRETALRSRSCRRACRP
jgi:hypothetical protein